MKKLFYTHLYPFYVPVWAFIMSITTAFFGTLVVIISFIPGLDPKMNFSYHYVARFWAWLNLALTGTRVKIKGMEKINKRKSYVVMSNHQSHFDVLTLIGHIPLQLRWVMKIELRSIPVFGIGCERLGMIYVDRSDSEKAHESLERAKSKISDGSSVIFFPEGTRSPDGRLIEFKKGGFYMAIETQTPILPITINGSRFALPKGKPYLMRAGKIEVIIHDPIDVKGLTLEDRDLLLTKVRAIIEKDLNHEYGRIAN